MVSLSESLSQNHYSLIPDTLARKTHVIQFRVGRHLLLRVYLILPPDVLARCSSSGFPQRPLIFLVETLTSLTELCLPLLPCKLVGRSGVLSSHAQSNSWLRVEA